MPRANRDTAPFRRERPWGNPELSMLWQIDPGLARNTIVEAFELEKKASDLFKTGLVDRTARRLKITKRCLYKWLEGKPELAALAKEVLRK